MGNINLWDRTADVEVLPKPTIFGISRTNSEGDINRKTWCSQQ